MEYPSTGSGQAPSTGSGQAGTEATRLYKYQWDLIHDPQTILFAWMEKEEEGEYKFNLVDNIRNINLKGGDNLLLSKTFLEKEKINITFKIPEQPTEIETQIKKYDIHINTRKYKKEIKKDKNEI